MNRASIWKNLPTIALVTVITLLIWILAESESVKVITVRADIQLSSDPSGPRVLVVEPTQGFTGVVNLKLEGTTARIDALAEKLRRRLVISPAVPGMPTRPGVHAIDLRTILRAHPVLRDSGVTIAESDPATVSVVLDDLMTRTVPVRVDIPDADLEGVPESTPATVSLLVPSVLESELTPDLVVFARPDPAAIARLPEGRRTVPNVRVDLPESLRTGVLASFVRIDPAQVTISITLRSRTDSATVAAVQVQLRIPPVEYGNWDITVPQDDWSISDVIVSGPRDVIAQIRDRTLSVLAVVPLGFEELERAAASDEPLIVDAEFLVETTALLKFEAKDRSVRLTIKRRNGPATPASGGPSPSGQD